MNKAIAFSKMGENEKAINDLDLAIALNEEYTKAYIKRGEIYLLMLNYEEAIRDFEKARSLDH